MTSSITVLQALLWENLSVYEQVVIKNPKRRRCMSSKFYANFHLRDDLQMELIIVY